MKYIKEYFPILLILFGGIMADLFNGLDTEIITLEIISWTSVAVGVIGSARIVWFKIKKWIGNNILLKAY